MLTRSILVLKVQRAILTVVVPTEVLLTATTQYKRQGLSYVYMAGRQVEIGVEAGD